jgi:Domain of unknown function (DUF397)
MNGSEIMSEVLFRKSSFSSVTNCAEAGVWKKATASSMNGGCVEAQIATDGETVPAHKAGEEVLILMRDSKDPNGPRRAFLAGVKAGEFDLAA